MSYEWFITEGTQSRGHVVPQRDLKEGSPYIQALEMLGQSWYMVASCFPQVKMWEVGNEWNKTHFFIRMFFGFRHEPLE